METRSEPWLRNEKLHTDPAVAAVLFALQQAEEDVERFTAGLSDEQIWRALPNLAPAGFQIRHLFGSMERLTTYLEDRALTEEQLAEVEREKEPGMALADMLAQGKARLKHTRKVMLATRPEAFAEPRYIGRKRIPTTAIGLMIHIADHTQRHLGQLIVTSRALRAAG